MFSPESANVIFDNDDGTYWTSGATLPTPLPASSPRRKKSSRYTLTPHAQATAPNNFLFRLQTMASHGRISIPGREYHGLPAHQEDVRGEVSGFLFLLPPLHIFELWRRRDLALDEMELIGDETQVNDVNYNYTNSTAAKSDLFSFLAMALAPDATLASVTVRVRAKQVTAAARNFRDG